MLGLPRRQIPCSKMNIQLNPFVGIISISEVKPTIGAHLGASHIASTIRFYCVVEKAQMLMQRIYEGLRGATLNFWGKSKGLGRPQMLTWSSDR